MNNSRNAKKLLLVGNWLWDIYEEAMAIGFRMAGWEVKPFQVLNYLPKSWIFTQLRRLRTKWLVSRLNDALVSVAETYQPDLVLIIRCEEILPETLHRLRLVSPNSVLVLYHNDNPFQGKLRRFTMRHFLQSLRVVDLSLVYRPSNVHDALAWGARRVEVLPPSYMGTRHRPVLGGESNDVIYIGHYEPDGRERLIEALYNAGVKVRIYGTQWQPVQQRISWLAQQKIFPVLGEEYAALLSSAKIALVFLSTRHRDVYTRRCFEIPACGSLMMAPRTAELEQYFEDGREAVFWDSVPDLVAKVQYYLLHDEERIAIAAAGRARVLADGHDEYARARQIIAWYEQERANR